MKKTVYILIFLTAWLSAAWCPAEPPGATTPSASELLQQIRTTYACGAFFALFRQVSTLKAMDITDTASGRAYFKEPGMMRWEYTEPEPQDIITDGKKLWIYKPLENQVMTGETPALFDDGQGVNFLAAIQTIEEKNEVSIDPGRTREDAYVLKLVPIKKTGDLATIYLYVSRQSGLVEAIETTNVYDDTTRIVFSDIHLGAAMDPSLFTFTIPAGADVMLLDTQK